MTTDLESAEMIKYAANAFLATKITFINEIAARCVKVGADVMALAGPGHDEHAPQAAISPESRLCLRQNCCTCPAINMCRAQPAACLDDLAGKILAWP